MAGDPKVKSQPHPQPAKRRSARPLSRERFAEVLRWLRVLHAEECAALCRARDGKAQHLPRCRRIGAVIAKAEGQS